MHHQSAECPSLHAVSGTALCLGLCRLCLTRGNSSSGVMGLPIRNRFRMGLPIKCLPKVAIRLGLLSNKDVARQSTLSQHRK